MSPIQIILLLALAGIIAKTFQNYQSDAISLREFFLWASLWGVGGALVVFPDAAQIAANFVGIGRGVDLVVYLALLALFIVLFYVLVRLERIERDITKIVRSLALTEKMGQKEGLAEMGLTHLDETRGKNEPYREPY